MKKLLDYTICFLCGAILSLIVAILLFNAVLQQSYREAPPTEYEMELDPSLERFN